jgi:1,2-diacylglycerol 3-alpha-glucosyltransferase
VRIAQFTESYRPVINGVAVALDLLTEEQAARHAVTVFAPRFPGYQEPETPGVEVRRFPSYRVPGHADYPLAIPFSPSLERGFRETRFDVVHTHSPFALGGVGRRWARRYGVRLVTTYHTLYVEYAHYAPFLPAGLLAGRLRALSRAYCDSCDVVAVPTEPIREVLLGYGVRRPIVVVPTGLKLRPPVEPDPAFPRGEFGIPPEAPLVVYAGRLAREKNLELLFSAFGRVAAVLPEARLLVAGSGPADAEARRLAAAAGCAERVTFAGFVSPDRMRWVYAAADVFAFSSKTDTQGLVLTEAKAAGLPAVSVNAYGPSVVVKDGLDGFLVPPEPEPFAAALLRVLTQPELRADLSRNALREAQNFGIEATAAAYERLYAGD